MAAKKTSKKLKKGQKLAARKSPVVVVSHGPGGPVGPGGTGG
jgi:hypothetical protein